MHVQWSPSGSQILANVYYGDAVPLSTPYLSLSHCWGPPDFLTIKKANIKQFELSLPVDRLSQTFKDAFLLTLELGFQYIWIDSLCITQDDHDDRNHEVQLMGNVYRNAACNISASAFADGNKGFMLPQREVDPTPFSAKFDWNSSKSDWFKDYRNSDCWLMHADPRAELARSPVYSRAWVLQEQLLVGLPLSSEAYFLTLFRSGTSCTPFQW